MLCNYANWKPLKIFRWITAVLTLSLLIHQPLNAEPVSREYTIKASLILKILDYVKWPEGLIHSSKDKDTQRHAN